MYYPIKGGQKIIVGEGFQCWVPPYPDKSQILFNHLPKEEQYWRRSPLPQWYIERALEEEYQREQELELVLNGQKKSVTFFDPTLERYRRQEWFRRKWGTWFMNFGEPVYLTGHQYWYLQWTKFDHAVNDGYPLFYEFSRDNFYIRQWCEENPFSLGYMMIASRGTGKSTEEIATITNRATMYHNHRAAIQGKHIDDVREKLVQAKLVPMFNNLPQFFKPQYSHGSDPKEALIFSRPSVRGKDSRDVKFGADQELKSSIFSAYPGEKVLDGDTLGDAYATETGKTDPKKVADVHTRHGVNIKTVVRNHVKVGIIREESTVEEMNEGGDECQKIWIESDPTVLDGNGFTKSKIHRHFISALDTDTRMTPFTVNGQEYSPPCNKYGKVDRGLAGLRIQADLDLVKNDLKELSSRMRKSPRTPTEAFIKDQSKSVFNIQILTNRIDEIENDPRGRKPYTKGNLYWLKEKFGPVGFRADEHAGRFNWAWFPDEYKQNGNHPETWRLLNNFDREWGYNRKGKSVLMASPKNTDKFKIATDPIQFSRTKDPRASKASIHGFRLFDQVDLGKQDKMKWESYNFIFEYINRPDDPEIYCEDLAMACFFLGCQVLPEKNVKTINMYFEQNGLEKFLFYPNQDATENVGIDVQGKNDEAGLASTTEVIDYYIRKLITFINDHGMRMPFERTMKDWMNFDPNNVTMHDPTVSSGFCLVHAEKERKEDRPPESKMSDWVDEFDNTGVNGTYANVDD